MSRTRYWSLCTGLGLAPMHKYGCSSFIAIHKQQRWLIRFDVSNMLTCFSLSHACWPQVPAEEPLLSCAAFQHSYCTCCLAALPFITSLQVYVQRQRCKSMLLVLGSHVDTSGRRCKCGTLTLTCLCQAFVWGTLARSLATMVLTMGSCRWTTCASVSDTGAAPHQPDGSLGALDVLW